MRSPTTRALAALAATAGVALVAWAAGFRVLRVVDDDMVPSLRPGDWLLVGPGPVGPGDVVRLPDPLDPRHTLLRRVLARGGQRIAFHGHHARVDDRPLEQVLMGDWGAETALMEERAWLLAVATGPTRYRSGPVDVPEGALFLIADHRDVALDSRWWGALPKGAIDGVVLLRFGPADAWRARVSSPRRTVRPEVPLIPHQPPS